jgi:hypothetical protein
MLKPPTDFQRHFVVRGRWFTACAYDAGTCWEYYASEDVKRGTSGGIVVGPVTSFAALVEAATERLKQLDG